MCAFVCVCLCLYVGLYVGGGEGNMQRQSPTLRAIYVGVAKAVHMYVLHIMMCTQCF